MEVKDEFYKIFLPCPRCGEKLSSADDVYSHPACGVLVTCKECGARSDWDGWQAGEIKRTRHGKHFKYVNEKYERQPPNA